MDSKDSVRFLANSLMGLGDRFNQQGQQTLGNNMKVAEFGLQQRQSNLAAQKMQQELDSQKRAVAQQNFTTATTMRANQLAAQNKTKPEDEMMNAAKEIYPKLTGESQRYLGDFANALGLSKKQETITPPLGGGEPTEGSVLPPVPGQGGRQMLGTILPEILGIRNRNTPFKKFQGYTP